MAYINFQPKDHMNTVAWTGTSSSPLNVTGYGFNPEMIWNKYRVGAGDHQLYDAVRGATKMLVPNSTNGQSTNANGVTAFITDGFTAGSDINVNGRNSVAWGWKLNGQGSANTDGTINTLYTSANTSSGVSVMTWNGTGSNGTIGHGLGKVPKMLLIKRTDGTQAWMVYHVGAGNNSEGQLTTGAFSGSSTAWQTTDPTSSVFYVSGSTGDSVNASGYAYVGYAFADVKGCTKVGKYIGNGNVNGAFIYTGFKPAFFMWKRSSSTGGWYISDAKRDTFNEVDVVLSANDNGSESDQGTTFDHDFVSNGIKIRNSVAAANSSGETFVYMAFAEHPLVSSNNVPATAR